eukprot:3465644-Alexandrium_andersonii.AAC.1
MLGQKGAPRWRSIMAAKINTTSAAASRGGPHQLSKHPTLATCRGGPCQAAEAANRHVASGG